MIAPKPKPSYAPVYAAALYPRLAEIVRECGYALAVHGSLARDFDLVCVPWQPVALDPSEVVNRITETFAVRQIGGAEQKEHGRIAITLSVGFGECAIDLSFMPRFLP